MGTLCRLMSRKDRRKDVHLAGVGRRGFEGPSATADERAASEVMRNV